MNNTIKVHFVFWQGIENVFCTSDNGSHGVPGHCLWSASTLHNVLQIKICFVPLVKCDITYVKPWIPNAQFVIPTHWLLSVQPMKIQKTLAFDWLKSPNAAYQVWAEQGEMNICSDVPPQDKEAALLRHWNAILLMELSTEDGSWRGCLNLQFMPATSAGMFTAGFIYIFF